MPGQIFICRRGRAGGRILTGRSGTVLATVRTLPIGWFKQSCATIEAILIRAIFRTIPCFASLSRIASLLLVLSAAVCLSTDLAQSFSGEQTSAQNDSCPGSNNASPDCFCCCTHVLPVSHVPFIAATRFTFLEPSASELALSLVRDPLVQPPRV